MLSSASNQHHSDFVVQVSSKDSDFRPGKDLSILNVVVPSSHRGNKLAYRRSL